MFVRRLKSSNTWRLLAASALKVLVVLVGLLFLCSVVYVFVPRKDRRSNVLHVIVENETRHTVTVKLPTAGSIGPVSLRRLVDVPPGRSIPLGGWDLSGNTKLSFVLDEDDVVEFTRGGRGPLNPESSPLRMVVTDRNVYLLRVPSGVRSNISTAQ